MSLSTIPEAVSAFRSGQFVIVVDDENRENEGDLVIAAECMTAEKMAFMIRNTGGVVCMPLTNEIADRLNLPAMVEQNTAKHGTPFTISIDSAEGITTGISAADRARTVRAAAAPNAVPNDFARPGHVFPLRAAKGGVLRRAGHTEAALDLCRLAGLLREVAALSELMQEDGAMMRLPELASFAKKHGLHLISISDLIAFRQKQETLVRCEVETSLITKDGSWKIRVYRDALEGREHVALIKGTLEPKQPVLVRVHSECLTGDVLGSLHCDCGAQLHAAMERIAKEGSGVILYMRQEGRGIGLINKLRAYDLQQKKGLDTVEANEALGFAGDLRDYGIGAQILKDIGISKLRLLTNNPRKIIGLQGFGLTVTEQVPLEMRIKTANQRKYMQTKREKFGHFLSFKP